VVYSVSPRNCWHSLIIVSFDLTQRELLRPLLNGTPDNTRNCVFNSRTMAVFNSYHSQHSHNLVHLSCSRTVYQCCVFSYTHTHIHTHAHTHTHTHADQSTDYTNGVNLCNWSVGNKLHSLLNKDPSVIPHAVKQISGMQMNCHCTSALC